MTVEHFDPLLLGAEADGLLNPEALAAWHRARGHITLVLDGATWNGAAAIDRSLVAGRHTPDVWGLADLHALGPVSAITFSGDRPEGVLLDRDGTVIADREYLADPEGVRLTSGAAMGLQRLQRAGLRLVVISNQSGVGTGRITRDQLTQVNQRLGDILSQDGVSLDGIFCCVHSADAGCDCRKPLPALAYQAAAELGLDLSRVVVVGDAPADIGLAQSLGVPSFLVTTGHGLRTLSEGSARPDYVVDDLDQLARICTHPAGLPCPVGYPILNR